MALEGYNAEKFNQNQKEDLAEAINQFEGEASKVAVDTIQNLNETQLTNFIEKSFKNNETHQWKPYSQMKKDTFYPFMVQATIDMFSNKLGDKKFDKDGNLDNENGKTLDDRIKEYGGIDNRYGPNTRKLVSTVQRILKINDDGLAGPQYFHTICSALNGTDIGDFAVEGIENYQYGIDDNIKNNLKENRETNLINKLELKEFNDPGFDYNYYGIQKGTKLYKQNESNKGYYYIDGNSVVYIPDYKSTGSSMNQTWTYQIYKNGKRENKLELGNNGNILQGLNNTLKTALKNAGIDTSGKEIVYEEGRKGYFLHSYYVTAAISEKTFTEGWIFKGEKKDIKKDIQLMNLANYIRSKCRKTFSFIGETLYGGNGRTRVVTEQARKKHYGTLSQEEKQRFVDYLNKYT